MQSNKCDWKISIANVWDCPTMFQNCSHAIPSWMRVLDLHASTECCGQKSKWRDQWKECGQWAVVPQSVKRAIVKSRKKSLLEVDEDCPTTGLEAFWINTNSGGTAKRRVIKSGRSGVIRGRSLILGHAHSMGWKFQVCHGWRSSR